MRYGLLMICGVLLTASFGHSSTLGDVFGQPQASCSMNPALANACDVIGEESLYDIQSATFSNNGGIVGLVIYLNSGAVRSANGQLSLQSFTDCGLTLIPGDIFFYNPTAPYDPSNPATMQNLRYGIALTDHGSFIAGDVYAIGGSVNVETAQTALGNPAGVYYRNNEAVLLGGSGSPVGSASISLANYGDGTANAAYGLTVTVPEAELSNAVSGGAVGLLFSSADCGNDVIQGTLSAPEPGPETLVLTGLGLLIAGSFWRRKLAQKVHLAGTRTARRESNNSIRVAIAAEHRTAPSLGD